MIQELNQLFEDAELAGWAGAGWYFWDETGCYCIGPFATKDIAEANEKDYVAWLKQAEGQYNKWFDEKIKKL